MSLLFSMGTTPAPPSGPTILQVIVKDMNGLSTITTDAVTTTNGSTFVAFCAGRSSTFTSITDSKSNTWANTANSTYDHCRSVIGGIGGSNHTFTFNFAGTEYTRVYVVEIANGAAIGAVSTNSNDDISSGTLPGAPAIVLNFHSCSDGTNPVVYSVASPFSILSEQNDGNAYWTSALASADAATTASVLADWVGRVDPNNIILAVT